MGHAMIHVHVMKTYGDRLHHRGIFVRNSTEKTAPSYRTLYDTCKLIAVNAIRGKN